MLADIAPWQIGIALVAVYAVVTRIVTFFVFRKPPRPFT